MKLFFLLYLVCNYPIFLLAQKPPLNLSALNDVWEGVDEPRISNDGRYSFYHVIGRAPCTVIQETCGAWRKTILKGGIPAFTENSRSAVFLLPGDSLCILQLGSDSAVYFTNVTSFKLPRKGNGEWIAYHLSGSGNKLVLRNLRTEKVVQYDNVNDYSFAEGGAAILLRKIEGEENTVHCQLRWADFSKGSVQSIWEGGEIGDYTFDSTGKRLAFTEVERIGEQQSYSLWYFQSGGNKAEKLIGDSTVYGHTGLALANEAVKFNRSGNLILFGLKCLPPKKKAVIRSNADKVEVWHYRDAKLQPLQQKDLATTYKAVIAINDRKVVRLTYDDETLVLNEDEGFDQYIMLDKRVTDLSESNWRVKPDLYIVSLITGERKLIKSNFSATAPLISPNERYVLYYDREMKNYFAYEIAKGVLRNVTHKIKVPLFDEEDDRPKLKNNYYPSIWLSDSSAFIYDRYDVWLVDLSESKEPVNITEGYGRRNNIVFRLVYEDKKYSNLIKANRDILLVAFNVVNKDNGFYSKNIAEEGDPKRLTMGPYIYHAPGISLSDHFSNPFIPIKARDTSLYIVRRMSVTEPPNYFSTSDFKSYRPLSNIQPLELYNWMTSELIKWKTPDGSVGSGILYKPENFDARKMYPVIIFYYEKVTNGLNEYIRPEPSDGPINIPYFVSNGYLVFRPDIVYKAGHTGECVYNAVVSGAKHIAALPGVDGRHMGITGHSFGGYETNYLVTATNMFAAACSAAGPSDLISMYQYDPFVSESDQLRMGTTPWRDPDVYIRNSPVFHVAKVNTPLLIMHGRRDERVRPEQTIGFFTALRRMGKKVWLLMYDEGGHQGGGLDFTIRLTQFFDYYLKGKLPPKWMTEGVPARMRGIDDGLELDTSGKVP